MRCKPKSYLKEVKHLGGYYLNNEYYTEELIIENTELVTSTKVDDINIIYQMVDNLNSVSFSINNEVLDYIIENNKEFKFYTDPDCPHELEKKLKKKGKLRLQEQKELASFNSIKQLELEILNLAFILRSWPEFFLPVRLDYRGRIYCNTSSLNYQGIELAKALLNFSKPPAHERALVDI